MKIAMVFLKRELNKDYKIDRSEETNKKIKSKYVQRRELSGDS